MRRRTISTTSAAVRTGWGLAAAALVMIGLSTTASAHTAPITASCEAGLSVSLTDYNGDGVNTLRVWIDGAERANTAFAAATRATFAFGDPTVTHTWRVSVSAFDDPTGTIGWSFDTGTSNIPVCATPTTAAPTTIPPATIAPTVTAPATTAPPTPAPTPSVPATVASAVVTIPNGPAGVPSATVVVAQAPPTPAAPSAAGAAADGALPVTGAADMRAVGLALLMLGFGILLIVATRRPDTA